MASLADISRRAGVSIATASRVLGGSSHPVSDAMRSRVLTAAEELGYRPSELARALVKRTSRIIGVIVGDIVDPYFAEIARGVDDVAARATIAAGIERLLPFAADHGVRLGIEPLHPMMVGERSAIVTLGEALALARRLDSPHAGVVVDVYHVFWDPRLEHELAQAHGLVAGHHVSDWLVPTPDLLAGRGLMGDGIIDLPRIRELVERAGYDGPVEVEVINPALAAVPPQDLLEDVKARFARG